MDSVSGGLGVALPADSSISRRAACDHRQEIAWNISRENSNLKNTVADRFCEVQHCHKPQHHRIPLALYGASFEMKLDLLMG